jgi:HlyD family secretion protein
MVWGSFTGVLLAGLIGAALIWGPWTFGRAETRNSQDSSSDNPGDKETGIAVKTVRPKLNKQEFVRSVTQPAYIRGFFQAEIMARVAGPVKFIEKNIGDRVKKGEVVVELDVPDLIAEVAQKEALVKQATSEANLAEALVKVMGAAKKAAKELIDEKRSDVDRTAAFKKFKDSELKRFKILVERKGATEDLIDEHVKDAEAASASWKSAQFAVNTAAASFEEFDAKLEAAIVDTEVKKARVEVAKADLAHAQAMLDFAKIRAPFDGMIVARKVDPGDFVQNASTGHPMPVLSLDRIDFITAVMWVPEKDAPYVTKDTEAVLRMDALGDREIKAKVTRLANCLDAEKGRDMRIEVDIKNKDLAMKPGMYGSMKLILQKFDNTYLIPSGAIFERNGKTYILEVKDEVANLVPVHVQLEDGVIAKVFKLVRQVNKTTGQPEVVSQELTGNEEIIRSGQGEIADGQHVRSNLVEW